MTVESSQRTQVIQKLVDRLKQGDESARSELLNAACERLLHLTRKIKRDFNRVGRWEQTDDVFQRASMRLYKSLEKVELSDAQHFLRLAATQIRRELIELSRRIDGPHGFAKNHATQPGLANNEQSNDGAGYAFDAAELTGDPRQMQ